MSVLPRLLPFLLCAPVAVFWLWPTPAHAQETLMNRCTGPGGSTIYTDRPCESIGAAPRLPRGAGPGNESGARRSGCARSVQELIYEITTAIDARDVNRLGGVYHWIGHGQDSGYRVLDRLQAIVDRPLVDIVPIRGASPTAIAEATGVVETPLPPAPDTQTSTAPGDGPAIADATGSETSPIRPVARRGPVGLRLEQTLKNGSTPSRTVFGLRRHLDCWWVTF